MIYVDCETTGFCGPAVLIQWAENNGPVHLHSVWTNPIKDTLELIEEFMAKPLVAFNISFDHFQLCKLYTMFSLFPDRNEEPQDIINELAELEPLARDGPCLKPVSVLDLMLHARKGPYQSTMDRSDIRIKRVPTPLAWQLSNELEKRIPLKEIYFAKRKNKLSNKWQVFDIEDPDTGEIDPDFKDIVLGFHPSSALKALAIDALNKKEDSVYLFSDVEVDKKWMPVEYEYAPFARAIGDRNNWRGSWPEVIKFHITHWAYHNVARKYASDDVIYLQELYEHFGRPAFDDDDSILACLVAACRWKGFRVDLQKIQALIQKREKEKIKVDARGNTFRVPTAPAYVRRYIEEVMSKDEILISSNLKKKQLVDNFETSTKKVLLQELTTWTLEDGSPHPVSIRAQEVLDARLANYEIDFYSKLLRAGRLHADFNVIGTLSSRMSGRSGVNTQGVKKTKEIRSAFPLAWPGYVLCAGDYSGFEVSLAEAVYNDDNLRKDLLTCEKCSGSMYFSSEKNDFVCKECSSNKNKKIHALFGLNVYPNMTYEEIKATDSTADDKYTRCKQAVFALMYGGDENTLKDRLGVDIDIAREALARFHRKYPGVKKAQKRIIEMFASMRQPGGIGSRVEWHEPSDYIESMLGFRRYFTLENQICKTLFLLANEPPKEWRNIQLRVMRRDRMQTVSGAVQSALFAAAFSIQSSNVRAAANHEIQSPGGQITKATQVAIWKIQPSGINPWIVQCFNVHDEIQASVHPDYVKQVNINIFNTVEKFRQKVPLIRLDWQNNLTTWADK